VGRRIAGLPEPDCRSRIAGCSTTVGRRIAGLPEPVKPEWLTRERIDEYAARMNVK